jgi:hypothetical protein
MEKQEYFAFDIAPLAPVSAKLFCSRAISD